MATNTAEKWLKRVEYLLILTAIVGAMAQMTFFLIQYSEEAVFEEYELESLSQTSNSGLGEILYCQLVWYNPQKAAALGFNREMLSGLMVLLKFSWVIRLTNPFMTIKEFGNDTQIEIRNQMKALEHLRALARQGYTWSRLVKEIQDLPMPGAFADEQEQVRVGDRVFRLSKCLRPELTWQPPYLCCHLGPVHKDQGHEFWYTIMERPSIKDGMSSLFIGLPETVTSAYLPGNTLLTGRDHFTAPFASSNIVIHWSIQATKKVRVSSTQRPCRQSTEFVRLPINHGKSQCTTMCIDEVVYHRYFNCSRYWMLRDKIPDAPCSMQTLFESNSQPIYNQLYTLQQNCEQQCQDVVEDCEHYRFETIFSIHTDPTWVIYANETWALKQFPVKYLPHVWIILERLTIPPEMLVPQIAGLLGLWLGISAVTIIEALGYLVKKVDTHPSVNHKMKLLWATVKDRALWVIYSLGGMICTILWLGQTSDLISLYVTQNRAFTSGSLIDLRPGNPLWDNVQHLMYCPSLWYNESAVRKLGFEVSQVPTIMDFFHDPIELNSISIADGGAGAQFQGSSPTLSTIDQVHSQSNKEKAKALVHQRLMQLLTGGKTVRRLLREMFGYPWTPDLSNCSVENHMAVVDRRVCCRLAPAKVLLAEGMFIYRMPFQENQANPRLREPWSPDKYMGNASGVSFSVFEGVLSMKESFWHKERVLVVETSNGGRAYFSTAVSTARTGNLQLIDMESDSRRHGCRKVDPGQRFPAEYLMLVCETECLVQNVPADVRSCIGNTSDLIETTLRSRLCYYSRNSTTKGSLLDFANCVDECRQIPFCDIWRESDPQGVESITAWSQSFNEFRLRVPTKVTKIAFEPAQELSGFIANIGGLVGMWFGISVRKLAEVAIENLVKFIRKLKKPSMTLVRPE